jgi:hypothetical protein
MEYHSDRFRDHSLIFKLRDEIVALLPSNVSGDTLYSHAGLTYGGFIVGRRMNSSLMLSIFARLKSYMGENDLKNLIYKAMPYVYFKMPYQEDLYALFINNANLIRRDIGTVVPLGGSVQRSLTRLRKRGIKKAAEDGVLVRRTNEYRTFMDIVKDVLESKYKIKPVHTWSEIEKLATIFPKNIILYGAFKSERMLAGVLLYISDNVVHAQYGFADDEGKRASALDLLYYNIFNDFYEIRPYFSFGISTENNGRYLNENLIRYKESLGGFSVVSDFYNLST